MEYQIALKSIVGLCSRSEKSESEIREKLDKMDLEMQERENIIEYLISNNYINNLRYASSFVNDKFKFNKWGKRKIEYMLMQKGIDTKTIAEALDSINYNDYLSMASEILKTKKKSIKESYDYKAKEKLYNFAISRGFEPHIIKKAIENI